MTIIFPHLIMKDWTGNIENDIVYYKEDPNTLFFLSAPPPLARNMQAPT